MIVYAVSYFNERKGKRVYLKNTFDKWGAIEQIRKRPTGKMHKIEVSIKRLREAAKVETVL